MAPMILYLLCFLLACLLSVYLTPLMRQAALRFGIVDRPDGRLKNQAEPVPYLGGLAVYIAFLVTLAFTFTFDREVLGLLLGGTLLLLLGLVDDFGVLSPKVKLMGQFLAAFVMVKAGIKVQIVFLPDLVNIILSAFWIVAVTNAFNIIDIMDGLAAGVASVCCLVLSYVAIVNGRPVIAMMTLSLAGAMIGFLRYNFSPAKIYLGDTGSLFIGCMIASICLIGSYTAHNRIGILIPVVVLGVPLFDMLFVSYIRWRRGMSILLGSPDHFALRLRKWRLTTRQTVLCSYGLSALLGVAGILMLYASDLQALMILAGITLLGLGLGYFLKKIDMTM
jgi:UDP-GlcNAc:undecaprenyl-phosphate GlcNAc-1-phosphate transferase